jgi:hypothetical protein
MAIWFKGRPKSDQLKQPFIKRAAKKEKEPTPDLSNSCCVRSLHGNFCNGVNPYADLQRENRSFMQVAAKT